MKGTIILKGNIIDTPTKDQFRSVENRYLVAVDNEIKGVFQELPAEYEK